MSLDEQELIRRLRADMSDSFDEELELELDDRKLDLIAGPDEEKAASETDCEERRSYFRELFRLQGELVKLQDWVVASRHKVVILFEGRDAAGKGGVIKRITQRLNPRVCRVAALPAPNDRERTQWYFQRYVAHLPAAGEMVLFDRSWYNRAGVERVMGFCDDAQYEEFFRSVPEFEKMLVRSGIQLIKYWFSISDEEQHLRFLGRIHDPLKQWKLSPMDLESRRRWEDYTRAKEIMLRALPHPGGAMVGGAGGRQEEGAPQLHSSSPRADALRGDRARTDRPAGTAASRGLHAPTGARRDHRPRGLLSREGFLTRGSRRWPAGDGVTCRGEAERSAEDPPRSPCMRAARQESGGSR